MTELSDVLLYANFRLSTSDSRRYITETPFLYVIATGREDEVTAITKDLSEVFDLTDEGIRSGLAAVESRAEWDKLCSREPNDLVIPAGRNHCLRPTDPGRFAPGL